MKVVTCHSHQTRCGIREYGMQLDRSLRGRGAEVSARSYDHVELGRGVDETSAGDVMLVHYEPGLVNACYLVPYLRRVKDKGGRVVFCCHWYDPGYMREYSEVADRFVVHRKYDGWLLSNTVVIPLGCPVYDIGRPDRTPSALRARFGLPQDKIVLTTIGFLTPWKALPDVALAFTQAVGDESRLFVRFHTPWPFDERGSAEHEQQIRHAIAGNPRFGLSTEYLSEEGTLDLARASDVGFTLHNIHTGSVSAATKQFVSARRPLVVTHSTHSSDLHEGVLRVPSFDCGTFARAAVELALSPERTETLRQQMSREYDRLNMDAVAGRYLELFEGLRAAP